MGNWVNHGEAVWLDATLGAILIAGLAALAMIQSRQPARRRTWGRLGLIGSLAVVPLVGLSPLPRLDLRHPSSLIWAVEARPPAVPAERSGGWERISRPLRVGEAAPLSSPRPTPPWTSIVLRGLALVYGCGLALGMSRLTLGIVGSEYLIRQSRPASARAVALLRSLPFAGWTWRRPRLRVSERTGRPVLVGVWRSTILIPPQLDQPTHEPQLRLGLLHELAHAEVEDHRFGLIAALAHAVWFFIPQVWWVRSQLQLDAEFLADHRAVGHFGTSYTYAESLVGLACSPVAPETTARAPSAIGSGLRSRSSRAGEFASALLQRVQMLLKCPFEVEDQPPWSWSAAVAVVMVVATLGVSCLSVRDWRDPTERFARHSVDQAVRAFRLAELAIAPLVLDDLPFDLRFRLPDQFRLVCEVFAQPADLSSIEILGYRLGPTAGAGSDAPSPRKSTWRRVEIVRHPGGLEAVHVDGTEVVPIHRPPNPASWLTIRPLPGQTTRLRDLELTFEDR